MTEKCDDCIFVELENRGSFSYQRSGIILYQCPNCKGVYLRKADGRA